MIRYFAGHPTAANLIMVSILALGITALPSINRETFPDVAPNEIQVEAIYPGASAENVEEAICRRIEDAVEDVIDIAEIRCEARQGRATAIVEMREGGSFDGLLASLQTEIDAIDDFPDQVEAPTVRQLGRTDFVAAVAVTGPMGGRDLKIYAENLKDRLQRLDGVSGIDIQGFSDHQFRVEIPAQTLRQYGLSVADIARTVGRQSVELPSGTIEGDDRDVLIRFDDSRRSPGEFERLVVVGGERGAAIRLGDIARITDRFEKAEQKVIFNGRRAAVLEIKKGKSADTLEVIDAVKSFVVAEHQRAPPDVTLAITRDVSSIVRDRLDMLMRNGVSGFILVVLVLMLFFTPRLSFWVAMGLPVSFAGAMFIMARLGYSIDMISMVGLLIAIGVLVDDALVIAENVARHARDGLAPLEAAIVGTREVAPGVLASFATTVAVFGPLIFLTGDIGQILSVLPVFLILTLSFSLIEAFLILPNHLQHSLARAAAPSRLATWVGAIVERLRDRALGPAVDRAVEWRYLTVGIAVMVLLGSVAMVAGGSLKFRAFPDLDGDVIEARILLPQGTPLARTEAVVAKIQSALERVDNEFTPRQPAGEKLVRNVTVQFSKNIDAFETGPHVATVSVDLLEAERRATSLDEVLARWRSETGLVSDVVNLKFTDFAIGPAGRAIDIRLEGADLERVQTAARELATWLAAYRGVHDLSNDLRPGKPEVRIALREGALSLGIEAELIASQLRAAFLGTTAAEIQVGSEAYEVDVRLDAGDKDSLADLSDFTVIAPNGRLVPLGAVATIEPTRGFARINRINGLRTVTLQGDIDTAVANAGEIVADTQTRFLPELADRFPDVGISFEGQNRESADTGGSIVKGFLFGLVAVFIMLAFLFRSYVEPLIVIIAIPMALVGAIWGHVAMGLDLSMPSMMGFVSLSGVVVNNSILLVLFIKLGTAAGTSVADAAHQASRQRFRAILLTTLTTVMGMLPLLSETSLQAQVLKPLVTSLAFGLVASAVFILFLVPALYKILDDFGLIRISAPAAR